MNSKLTPTFEQRHALQEFAKKEGRNWKSELRQAWMTGIYPWHADTGLLQQCRNSYGPAWLAGYKLPPEEPLTNGEAFDAADHMEFLRWMKNESACIPQNDDEMNALMHRWIIHKRRCLSVQLDAMFMRKENDRKRASR